MKRILSICTIAAVMAASCNSKPKVDAATTTVPNQDTVGLAKFQQWKAQNELAEMNAAATTPEPQKTVVVYKNAPAKKSPVYSNSSESGNTAKSAEKKGISKAAKGAIIGGVGGAAAGAVINKKNRAAGAVIGGVLGAGAGYGIGRSKDKKDGRY
jgi:hypothetical protein